MNNKLLPPRKLYCFKIMFKSIPTYAFRSKIEMESKIREIVASLYGIGITLHDDYQVKVGIQSLMKKKLKKKSHSAKGKK